VVLADVDRGTGNERCLKEWQLPLEKLTESISGTIKAQLVWAGEDILYHISLRGWASEGQQPGQRGTATTQIITNLAEGEKLPEMAASSQWSVRVEPNPCKYAFPIDNNIIVEK
jgi:hypothetical protein